VGKLGHLVAGADERAATPHLDDNRIHRQLRLRSEVSGLHRVRLQRGAHEAGREAGKRPPARAVELREREDLLLVRALVNPAGLPAPNVTLDKEIVNGALQVQGLLPQLEELNYQPDKGLGYTAAGGWQVWLGSGAGMADRMLIYEALVGDLARRGIQPVEINVANPHSPYYTVAGSQ
jgi:hypothetical protein